MTMKKSIFLIVAAFITSVSLLCDAQTPPSSVDPCTSPATKGPTKEHTKQIQNNCRNSVPNDLGSKLEKAIKDAQKKDNSNAIKDAQKKDNSNASPATPKPDNTPKQCTDCQKNAQATKKIIKSKSK